MTELFVHAFILGFLFNTMPGAILTESLRRGIRGGFRPALEVQMGSLAGDFIWAVLGLLGAGVLFTLPQVEKPLAIAGAVLLGWIAWQALRDGLSPMPAYDPFSPATGGQSAVSRQSSKHKLLDRTRRDHHDARCRRQSLLDGVHGLPHGLYGVVGAVVLRLCRGYSMDTELYRASDVDDPQHRMCCRPCLLLRLGIVSDDRLSVGYL